MIAEVLIDGQPFGNVERLIGNRRYSINLVKLRRLQTEPLTLRPQLKPAKRVDDLDMFRVLCHHLARRSRPLDSPTYRKHATPFQLSVKQRPNEIVLMTASNTTRSGETSEASLTNWQTTSGLWAQFSGPTESAWFGHVPLTCPP